MRKKAKAVFSLLVLCLVLLQSSIPAFASDFSYVQFGAFPQEKVEDGAVLAALNGLSPEWQDAGYMRFADVELDGAKYRAVTFDTYRTKKTDGTGMSHQKRNGYRTGTVYWFAYTPILWRVLDRESGLCMSEKLLDSQPMNQALYRADGAYYADAAHTIYAHDYGQSFLRKWLTEDFTQAAFTPEQQAALLERQTDLYSYPRAKEPVTASVSDKVFLLTRRDVIEEKYGFNHWISVADPARRARGTDYAACQGLKIYALPFTGYFQNSLWWMSAPGYATNMVNKVYFDGYCSGDSYRNVTYTHIGVRPCICLDLSALPDTAFVTYENPIPQGSVIAAWIWRGLMAFVRLFGPIEAWFV